MNDAVRKPVTRQDVARYAGVSTTVISYVLNAGPRPVAPATRERVLEAIRVLGYRPNAAARALKLGSTELFGLVVPDATNPYFAELGREIEKAADAHGYAVLLTSAAMDSAQERTLLRRLVSRQVDGLLLASMESAPDLSVVDAAGIPVVLLDRSEPAEGHVAVGVDYRGASRAAVEHLLRHGHVDVGLVVGLDPARTSMAREQGWLDALRDAGLPEGPVARAAFTRAGGYVAGQRLLNRRERPTAVFVSSDIQAVGLLRALHEAGVRVPEEMAVISFDGSVESEFSWPPLTAVRQPTQAMAEAGIDALVNGARRHRTAWITCPTELIVRASCGAHDLAGGQPLTARQASGTASGSPLASGASAAQP